MKDLYVKIGKESQESKAPECSKDDWNSWVITLDEEELECVKEDSYKLNLFNSGCIIIQLNQ